MLFLAFYATNVPQRCFLSFIRQYIDLKVPIKGFLGGPRSRVCKVEYNY
jgi:hypothetical protein